MSRKRTARRRRGLHMMLIGAVLMLTKFIGLPQEFLFVGLIFVGLGLGDIFYDSRYKRRF
jgi:hypothetical protein